MVDEVAETAPPPVPAPDTESESTIEGSAPNDIVESHTTSNAQEEDHPPPEPSVQSEEKPPANEAHTSGHSEKQDGAVKELAPVESSLNPETIDSSLQELPTGKAQETEEDQSNEDDSTKGSEESNTAKDSEKPIGEIDGSSANNNNSVDEAQADTSETPAEDPKVGPSKEKSGMATEVSTVDQGPITEIDAPKDTLEELEQNGNDNPEAPTDASLADDTGNRNDSSTESPALDKDPPTEVDVAKAVIEEPASGESNKQEQSEEPSIKADCEENATESTEDVATSKSQSDSQGDSKPEEEESTIPESESETPSKPLSGMKDSDGATMKTEETEKTDGNTIEKAKEGSFSPKESESSASADEKQPIPNDDQISGQKATEEVDAQATATPSENSNTEPDEKPEAESVSSKNEEVTEISKTQMASPEHEDGQSTEVPTAAKGDNAKDDQVLNRGAEEAENVVEEAKKNEPSENSASETKSEDFAMNPAEEVDNFAKMYNSEDQQGVSNEEISSDDVTQERKEKATEETSALASTAVIGTNEAADSEPDSNKAVAGSDTKDEPSKEPQSAEPKQEALGQSAVENRPIVEELGTRDVLTGPKDSELVEVKTEGYTEKAADESPIIELTKPDSIRQYLDDTVLPILREGLRKLVKQRPENPYKFLAEFLVENRP